MAEILGQLVYCLDSDIHTKLPTVVNGARSDHKYSVNLFSKSLRRDYHT